MILEKETIRNYRVPVALVIMQLVLGILVVLQLLKALGFSFDSEARVVSVVPSSNPLEYFFLALVFILFFIVVRHGNSKYREIFVATQTMPFNIRSTAKFKLWLAANDPRAAALLLIQFGLAMTVVISIVAYFDPDYSVVKWERLGIFSPITTILNIIIFALVVGMLYYLYNLTRSYRQRKA